MEQETGGVARLERCGKNASAGDTRAAIFPDIARELSSDVIITTIYVVGKLMLP